MVRVLVDQTSRNLVRHLLDKLIDWPSVDAEVLRTLPEWDQSNLGGHGVRESPEPG